MRAWISWLMEIVLARTTEEGSRQLIWAAIAETDKPTDLRGAYVSLASIQEPSDYVISEEGQKAQNILWVSPFGNDTCRIGLNLVPLG